METVWPPRVIYKSWEGFRTLEGIWGFRQRFAEQESNLKLRSWLLAVKAKGLVEGMPHICVFVLYYTQL